MDQAAKSEGIKTVGTRIYERSRVACYRRAMTGAAPPESRSVAAPSDTISRSSAQRFMASQRARDDDKIMISVELDGEQPCEVAAAWYHPARAAAARCSANGARDGCGTGFGCGKRTITPPNLHVCAPAQIFMILYSSCY